MNTLRERDGEIEIERDREYEKKKEPERTKTLIRRKYTFPSLSIGYREGKL